MYDYVIVGAGSAGCVLANRLTEDPTISVLLVEAGGPDRKQEIHIPAAFSKLFKSPVDWAYETEEQPHLKNRKLYWPRGKMLGGSSSLNAMMYIRGNGYDYDSWSDLGNEGWKYSEVLPYFKKSEHQEQGISQYHGVEGPLNVADLRSPNPLSTAFIEAGIEVGLSRNADFNAVANEGVGFTQVTQKQGKRHSTAGAFLKPAMKRPNLTVLTNVSVTGLLIEKAQVVGVRYARESGLEEVRVNREVILCGGTINSPQLLLLSGIGPADQLRALNIPVVVDLPGVGENLQDHPAMAAVYQCTQPVTLASAETMGNILNYLLFKKGPLTSNIAEAAAFIKTKSDLPVPDLEIIFAPVYFLNHGFGNPSGHGFTIGAVLLTPQSRGRITLRNTNPLEPPLIQPNYLSSEADLHVLIEGVKVARRFGQARAFDSYRGEEVVPGQQMQSDQAIADAIGSHAETLYHPVGTCKMGNDAMAVVDSQLRVRGLDGLRVVDASIMPTIISGHTNAPAIMIAEKAADIIKGSSKPSDDTMQRTTISRS